MTTVVCVELLKEEEKLDVRKKLTAQKHNSRNLYSSVDGSFKTFKGSCILKERRKSMCDRERKEQLTMLDEYKVKLAIFVLDELNDAQSALSFRSTKAEIGLSIDAEVDFLEEKTNSFTKSFKTKKLRSPKSSNDTQKQLNSLLRQLLSFVPKDIAEKLEFVRKDLYFYEVLYFLKLRPSHSKKYQKCFTFVLIGLENLFSNDILNGSTKLFSLFNYFNVRLRKKLFEEKNFSLYEKLTELLCKYYFYYCKQEIQQLKFFLSDLKVDLSNFVNVYVEFLDELPQSGPGPKKTLREKYLESIMIIMQLPRFTELLEEEDVSLKKLDTLIKSFMSSGPEKYATKGERKAAEKTYKSLFTEQETEGILARPLRLIAKPSLITEEASSVIVEATEYLKEYIPSSMSRYLTRRATE
eukprot:snap_masked-scaffold_26-processed-gene-1.32-mRNA-1 protein AED:1.00 eAED:1.00 QI:0/0/0/0/1/1/2/0/410